MSGSTHTCIYCDVEFQHDDPDMVIVAWPREGVTPQTLADFVADEAPACPDCTNEGAREMGFSNVIDADGQRKRIPDWVDPHPEDWTDTAEGTTE